MKPKYIKGVLVDTTNSKVIPYTLKLRDYKDIARACLCTTITCVSRVFNGIRCDVWCDDEALLKQDLPPIAIKIYNNNNELTEMLLGNCFICDHTENGDMKSLTYKQIDTIVSNSKNGIIKGEY